MIHAKPSTQCKIREAKNTQPVILVTKSQQPNQLQRSFTVVTAKPNQNWIPVSVGPDNGRLQNEWLLASIAWKPSMQCKSRVTKNNSQLVIVVTKSQQQYQLQLSFKDVDAKPKQNLMTVIVGPDNDSVIKSDVNSWRGLKAVNSKQKPSDLS